MPSAGICSALSDAISIPAIFMSEEADAVACRAPSDSAVFVQSACVGPSEHDKSHTSAEAEVEAIARDNKPARAYVMRRTAIVYAAYASVQSADGRNRDWVPCHIPSNGCMCATVAQALLPALLSPTCRPSYHRPSGRPVRLQPDTTLPMAATPPAPARHGPHSETIW